MPVLLLLSSFLFMACSAPASQPPTSPARSADADPAARSADVVTRDQQAALTPDAVLADLRTGNERFIKDQAIRRDHLAQARATASGQYPKAIILSCVDSRVLPEIIFDQGIGDLFVARIAGNFENSDILGSMEFATQLAGSRLIVVLGHSSCGAVEGACDGAELGNLTESLTNIGPAIEASRHVPEPHDSSNADFVAAVAHANVDQTVRDITEKSPVLRQLVEKGSLRVVGAMYDLGTGRVTWR